MGATLSTKAEQLADGSRTLPGFKNLSLPGIKEQVAQILSLIGREGIFSTYTIHDISHIDAMLSMLDWLVPESTRNVMTPVDWLLMVLAIYFHDLGMVTTSMEYERRNDNPEFTSWRDALAKTSSGREYLARMNRMNAEEKELFLFQEFIRKGHAQRIREWITGRHTRDWGPHVRPIANRVAELVKSPPARFRDYLATACESHHLADLDRTDRYPLVARFGNDANEVANVQYASVLLRTTDLLHVTKDRTPSAMYEWIKFSDPKSVEEWDKQLGTFAVGPKGRKLEETDPDSAVIVLNADFTEERPLFALQEYIAYADTEIKQSKRWIDISKDSPDGRDYSFPWHKLEGDVRLEGVPPQPMRFELDRGQLLDLLVGHTIYNDPTVAVRELLQNSIDAVRYQAHLSSREALANHQTPPALGKVTVAWNAENKLLTVQDDGIGMDRDIIRHHLMNVGSSYYNTPQFEAEHGDFVPISRFGIGILTCFMISDDIEIVTLRGTRGFRIRMTSVKSTYLLRELERGDPLLDGLEPHGTRVRLRVRDTVDLSKSTILDIVKHWVILPECGVEYQDGAGPRVRIGFASVAEALIHYQFPPDEQLSVPHWAKLQVIRKSRTTPKEDGGSAAKCELAFGVYSGYYPERSFATSDASSPRVCIEGIRVADHLPGFERGPDPVGALLSVRGSRKFRTTVSRAGLEMDDEYRRVAKLCAEMLFEHVDDEAKRIADKPGKPLSQAATGARYLTDQILMAGRITRPEGFELSELQPTLVIERVDATGDRPITSRSLISPAQLREISPFWTIESRSVDSLGIISLDLGRELSLNEFLLALAPDVTQLKYSPIIPDAHRSYNSIRSFHYPTRVEFSRQHQQTAIEWARKTRPSECGVDLNATMQKYKLQGLIAHLRQQGQRFGREFDLRIELDSAPISGDDAAVMAVSSRMGTVLRDGSNLLQLWRTIRTALVGLSQADSSFEDLVCALNIANAFSHALSSKTEPRDRGGTGGTWREHISQFKGILSMLKIEDELPPDLRDCVTPMVVFDATSFWRDWDRGTRGFRYTD